MRKTHLFLAACFAATLTACGQSADSPETSEEQAAAEGEYERGPHNGRMLRDGDFAIEVTVFEDGVPPEYRLYAYRDNEQIGRASCRERV